MLISEYSYVNSPICWGTYVWVNCLTSWAKNRIIHDRIRGEVNIPCPNYQWHQSLMPFDLINIIGIKEFEKVNEIYTDLYITNSEDMRKCPNEKCNYAGFILLQPWHHPLKWPECNYSWRDYAQLGKYQRWLKSIKDTANFKSETFSYMNEVLTGSPCPKCGLVIWKDGGCNHMVCQKWKFEFCWLWLGHYPGYRHTENTFCPIRKFITFLMWMYLFMAIDLKFSSIFPMVGYLQTCALYWIWYIIPPNIFGLCFFIEFGLIGWWTDFFRYSTSCWQKCMKICLGILCIIYPIAYFYLWYKMWLSEYWWFMVKVVFWEILIVIWLFVGFWVCYFLIFLFVVYIVPAIWNILKMSANRIYSVIMKITTLFKGVLSSWRKIFYLTSKEKQRSSIVRSISYSKKKKKSQ